LKPINLLPKKPFWETWFIPLLAGIAAIYILAFAGLASGTLLLQQQHEKQSEEIERVSDAIRAAAVQRQPDPLSIQFDRYRQLIEGLEQSRYNWIPALDTIAASLPKAARLQSAEFDPKSKKITLNAEFRQMEDAAAYVGALRSSNMFTEVLVSDVAKESVSEPVRLVYYSLTVGLTVKTEQTTPGDAP
jgi:hypothetical protein